MSQCKIVILFPLLVYLTELCIAAHCQIITKFLAMIVLMLTRIWSLETEVELHVHPKITMAVTEPLFKKLSLP
jgi:hypothetical protein